MPVDLKTIEDSNELKELTEALSDLSENMLKLVADCENADAAKMCATQLTNKVKEILDGDQCPPGMHWDPVTETCVPN